MTVLAGALLAWTPGIAYSQIMPQLTPQISPQATLPAQYGQQPSSSIIPGITGVNDEEESGPTAPPFVSAVAWIDNAFPRNQVRVRFGGGYNLRRPERAEYYWPKGGYPGAHGPPKAEIGVDAYEMSTYVEYAFDPWMSLFMESPIRFLNPVANPGEYGTGDVNLGLRLMIYAGDSFQTTLQVRGYLPTGRKSTLGTNHVTIEPALLSHLKILDHLHLESEVSFWAPIGGSEFAGNILHYGIGLSYGQRAAKEITVIPVIEAVGWSVLDGQQFDNGTLVIRDAANTNILNVNGGIRWGLGQQADIYTGYSRCITGPSWFRQAFRIELRMFF